MLDIHDIHNLMADLAQHRPIFHSEADFQHALAWQIHETMPDCKIRLELPYRKEKDWHLDIWLSIPRIAIELKYRTKELELEHEGEHFSLRNHRAQPQGRYEFLEDLQRLEQVITDKKAKSGFAVLLTNDQDLWDSARGWKTTIDAAFRLHEDRKVTG